MTKFRQAISVLLCAAFLFVNADNINPRDQEDEEIIKLACMHSGQAFMLENMDSIQFQSITEGTSVETLIEGYLKVYTQRCNGKINQSIAWNVIILFH